MRRWTFTPATRNGKPVAAKITVPFHFAAPTPVPVPVPVPVPAPSSAPPPPTEVRVHGRADFPTRGAGDYDVSVGQLRAVPRADAASMLRLAPGVVLQNEGGSGHPQQILMRGFDAREGQDIEFTVDGIPLNEVGNPHGDGLTDLHLILPELVSRVRVLQGPFAPQQGNYAVAGSVHFDLGVQEPGLTLSTTLGSFGTRRMLGMWRPGKSERTFVAAELAAIDGFGQNRESARGTAIGGYEVPVGKTATVRFLTVAYATQYKQPGPVRADDVAAGRMGFFDTYDPTQGGNSSRFLFGATYADKVGAMQVSQSAFAGYRDFRVRANETGLLEDPRGDLLDQRAGTWTFGGRGSARQSTTALGLKQELELGYFARVDRVESVVERDLFRTTTPFQTDSDLASTLSNLGVYADTSLKPVRWLTLRGGLRGEFFGFDVHDRLPSATALMAADALRGGRSHRAAWVAPRRAVLRLRLQPQRRRRRAQPGARGRHRK